MKKNPHCDSEAGVSERLGAQRSFTLVLAIGVPALLGERARGEDQAAYRYHNYKEEDGRIRVETHSTFFEVTPSSALTLSGEAIYDAISGASPTGGPPRRGSNQVPLASLEDERQAGSFSASIRWLRNQTTTPQIAYSTEHDYESIGASLTHAIELNEKNTTVSFGGSYTYDDISPQFWNGDSKYKRSAEFLIGLSQLLGPKTILSVSATYGGSHGYLADPYKVFRFSDYPLENVTFAEERPGFREKQIGFASLTHHFTPLNGSAELSYRFYHDSYGIFSHTTELNWRQKLGKHVLISPMFRFMDQTAADFYAMQLPGDPTASPSDPFASHYPIPQNYSADYRLSALQSFTYGVTASITIKEHVTFDLGYTWYEMVGTDNKTSDSAYPKANIFTAGLRVLF